MYARYVAIKLPSYGMKKDRLYLQRKVTHKLRKGEQSFL